MLICYLLFKYLQYFHFTRKGKYRELSIHVYAYSKFFSSEMENIVKKIEYFLNKTYIEHVPGHIS